MSACFTVLPSIEKIYYFPVTGDTFTYYLSGDTLTIPDQSIFKQLNCFDEQSVFSEKLTLDAKGSYYFNELDVTFPNFNNASGYSFTNKYVFLLKANQYWHCAGYYSSLKVNQIQNDVNPDENKQLIGFISNSYQKVRGVLNVGENCNLGFTSIVSPATGPTTANGVIQVILTSPYIGYVDTSTYSIGNIAFYNNSVYVSLINGNISNTPPASLGVQWAFVRNYSLLYSVDGINFQSSNTFATLLPAVYNVTAKDVLSLSCSLSIPVTVTHL